MDDVDIMEARVRALEERLGDLEDQVARQEDTGGVSPWHYARDREIDDEDWEHMCRRHGD